MRTKEAINKQRAKRRLYNKIKALLNKHKCLFLTLSFNDETMKRTSEKTRERYIKEFLKNETALYIANRDYGTKNGREHYHALIVACTLTDDDIKGDEMKRRKNQINFCAYKYGNINARFIGTRYQVKGERANEQTALNLTNHFLKDTTRESRIITSRQEPSQAEQLQRLKRLIKDSKKADETRLNDKERIKAINDALSDFNEAQDNDFNEIFYNHNKRFLN